MAKAPSWSLLRDCENFAEGSLQVPVPVLDYVFVDLSEPPVGLPPGSELVLSITVRVSRLGHRQDGAQLGLFNWSNTMV